MALPLLPARGDGWSGEEGRGGEGFGWGRASPESGKACPTRESRFPTWGGPRPSRGGAAHLGKDDPPLGEELPNSGRTISHWGRGCPTRESRPPTREGLSPLVHRLPATDGRSRTSQVKKRENGRPLQPGISQCRDAPFRGNPRWGRLRGRRRHFRFPWRPAGTTPSKNQIPDSPPSGPSSRRSPGPLPTPGSHRLRRFPPGATGPSPLRAGGRGLRRVCALSEPIPRPSPQSEAGPSGPTGRENGAQG